LKLNRTKIAIMMGAAALLLAAFSPTYSADKMPAAKAGIVGQPKGKIAFIRDKNVWMVNLDKQMLGKADAFEKICEATNADGRLSWSPDNKEILFTRSGSIDVKSPDMMGGRHKVYDIFEAFLDSAYANNRLWWLRITSDLGSRDPEWSADGKKVVFWRDMNANYANSDYPSYQVCTMNPDGSSVEMIRKDWQVNTNEFMIAPSMAADGRLAFTYLFEQKPQGIVVIKPTEYMLSTDSLHARALKNLKKIAPSWSPDGKWIAYIFNDLNSPGVHIASPDFSEDYLVFVPPVGTNLYTVAPSFSPDSKWMTFSTSDGSIWVCDITGNGARRLSGPGLDSYPAWSKAVAKAPSIKTE